MVDFFIAGQTDFEERSKSKQPKAKEVVKKQNRLTIILDNIPDSLGEEQIVQELILL